MPANLLGPLITSKTRLKLLLRFFVNQDLSGYLQGLSKELDENSNSVRLELNRLEEAGMLCSELEGRRKLYRVNKKHPLTSDLTTMLRKVTGIDTILERVISKVQDQLKEVWICGKLAQGLDSETIEVVLIGEGLDQDYISGLVQKTEEIIDKRILCKIKETLSEFERSQCLMVWQKGDEK